MGWSRTTNAVGDASDPLRIHQIETLASKIADALNGHVQLDQIVVMRKHGRGGWKQTEFGLAPTPVFDDEGGAQIDPEDLDPHKAADEILTWIDAHADAEGPGDYQVRGVGLNSRGNSANLFSLHIPKGGEEKRSEKEIEGGDILRSAKEMVAALVNANGVLLGNMSRMSDQTEKAYEAANKANSQLVEIEKIKMEIVDRRLDREREERDAERDAKLSSERMNHGITVLGMVADGFMAHLANKGGVDVKRGDASATTLGKIFETLTPEEKNEAKAAVGDEVWDLFLAALKEQDKAKRNALLREIKRRFDAWSEEEKNRRGKALADAIGHQRVAMIMAAVRGGA